MYYYALKSNVVLPTQNALFLADILNYHRHKLYFFLTLWIFAWVAMYTVWSNVGPTSGSHPWSRKTLDQL